MRIIDSISTHGYKLDISTVVLKLNKSVSVLDNVISSNHAMKIQLEKTFQTTQDQLDNNFIHNGSEFQTLFFLNL